MGQKSFVDVITKAVLTGTEESYQLDIYNSKEVAEYLIDCIKEGELDDALAEMGYRKVRAVKLA